MSHFRSKRARLLLSLPLFALFGAACGNDHHGTSAAPTATPAGAPSRTPPATATVTRPAVATATHTFAPPPTGTATTAPSAAPSATPTASPSATPRLPTSAEILAPGPHGVGVTTIKYVDTSRPTMPNGTYAGTASRTLVTEIWYPLAAPAAPSETEQRDAPIDTAATPYPLIMYSHGYIENRTGGAYLARHLASYGYIVAAPDFPLSNGGAPGGPTINDVPEQPGDISFVIDQLLAPDTRFAGAIDAQRIGFTGLSLGGWTTFLAAYHPTLRDPRVRAAAPIAGPSCYFSHAYFADTDTPLLIVQGDLDALVPYTANSLVAYGNANPPKTLVTVHNGSHTGFSGLGALIPGDNPDDVGCTALLSALQKSPPDQEALLARLGGSAAGIDASPCVDPCTAPMPLPPSVPGTRQLQLAELSVFPFFEATLRGDAAMQRFLDQGLAAENPEILYQTKR